MDWLQYIQTQKKRKTKALSSASSLSSLPLEKLQTKTIFESFVRDSSFQGETKRLHREKQGKQRTISQKKFLVSSLVSCIFSSPSTFSSSIFFTEGRLLAEKLHFSRSITETKRDLDFSLALARFFWFQKYGEFLSKAECLAKVFEAITPLVGLKKVRRGRSSQGTPVPLSEPSRTQLAWKWIFQSAGVQGSPPKDTEAPSRQKGKARGKISEKIDSSPSSGGFDTKLEKEISFKFGNLRTKKHASLLGQEFFKILEGTSNACQEKEKWYKRIQKSRIHANPRWWRG